MLTNIDPVAVGEASQGIMTIIQGITTDGLGWMRDNYIVSISVSMVLAGIVVKLTKTPKDDIIYAKVKTFISKIILKR